MAEMCQNCGAREATENWVCEGGTLAYMHGAYWRWCRLCVLRAQLAHAEVMAESIPELEWLIERESDGR